MKSTLIIIAFFILWLISIPCTVLVIIFQLAKDNSDELYVIAKDIIKDKPQPTPPNEVKIKFPPERLDWP